MLDEPTTAFPRVPVHNRVHTPFVDGLREPEDPVGFAVRQLTILVAVDILFQVFTWLFPVAR